MSKQSTPIERAMEAQWGPDCLTAALRGASGRSSSPLAEGEPAETLAAQQYERTLGRRGYRNGREVRNDHDRLGGYYRRTAQGRLR